VLNPIHVKISKTRVLIVNDKPVVRERLAQLINADENLTLSGAADSSAAAFELIAAGNPHVVVIGLSLKGSHGFDLIKDLRNRYPDMRVLVFSAHDESVYAERAVRAGARGFVTTRKPSEHVLIAIRHILGGGIYLSDRVTSDTVQRFFACSPRATQSEISQLSDRELQVFELIGRGRSGREIATALFVNIKTIETYRSRIKVKLGIHSGAELTQHAGKWVVQAVSGGAGEVTSPLDNRRRPREKYSLLNGSALKRKGTLCPTDDVSLGFLLQRNKYCA